MYSSEERSHLFYARLRLFCQVHERWLSSPWKLLPQLLPGAFQAPELLDLVERQVDGARLLGDGTADKLANPPGGIGAEAIAEIGVKLLDGTHQPQIALVPPVFQCYPQTSIVTGDRKHEAQIGLGEPPAGLLRGPHLRGSLSGARGVRTTLARPGRGGDLAYVGGEGGDLF